jgi:ankyrin repeat protein
VASKGSSPGPRRHVLLRHGADVSLQDAQGRSALDLAEQSRRLELVALLRGRGATAPG